MLSLYHVSIYMLVEPLPSEELIKGFHRVQMQKTLSVCN